MSTKYSINFRNLIGGLMPQALRGSLLSFAWMLTHEIRVLHLRGLAARTRHWKDMEYNCQYPLLQKKLNDEVDPDPEDRRIRVREATGELQTVVVHKNDPSYVQVEIGLVVVHPWRMYLYRPFEISVPEEIYNNYNEKHKVIKLADTYKLAGTKYTITQQVNE